MFYAEEYRAIYDSHVVSLNEFGVYSKSKNFDLLGHLQRKLYNFGRWVFLSHLCVYITNLPSEDCMLESPPLIQWLVPPSLSQPSPMRLKNTKLIARWTMRVIWWWHSIYVVGVERDCLKKPSFYLFSAFTIKNLWLSSNIYSYGSLSVKKLWLRSTINCYGCLWCNESMSLYRNKCVL